MRHVKAPYHFEINLTKLKWTPQHVEEIARVVSRSFETNLTLKDIQPIIGTDHVKKWPIREDRDIGEFMKAPSMMNEHFAEKVIKFAIPNGLMPKKWEPKKVKILAKGQRASKFFGEDQVSTRQVELTLKLFDCGHFYMKQTLPGSGASPYWVIFEGRWSHSEKGLKLEYLLRYSWQASRKPDLDFAIEAATEKQDGALAWCGETSETQLNGNVPAIVGEDAFCWIEIYREPDVIDQSKMRLNDECPDPPSWKAVPKKKKEEGRRPSEELDKQIPEQEEHHRHVEQSRPEAQNESAMRSRDLIDQRTQTDTNSRHRQPTVQQREAPSHQRKDDDYMEDTDQAWPMYVGLFFFIVIVCAIAYLNWKDRTKKLAMEALTDEEL